MMLLYMYLFYMTGLFGPKACFIGTICGIYNKFFVIYFSLALI